MQRTSNYHLSFLWRSKIYLLATMATVLSSFSSYSGASGQAFIDIHQTSPIPNAIVVGEAYALGSTKRLYTEYHSFSDSGLIHQVRYVTVDNQPLADKTIMYGNNLIAPEFTQINHVTKTEVAVHWQQDKLQLHLSPHGFDKLINPPTNLPIVIDAGFDNLIRQHWDALFAFQSVSFNFVLAKRGSIIQMKIKRHACAEGTDVVCLTLEPDAWLIKVLAPTTNLTYSQGKYLLRYRGLSNIEGKSGDDQLVDIHYRRL